MVLVDVLARMILVSLGEIQSSMRRRYPSSLSRHLAIQAIVVRVHHMDEEKPFFSRFILRTRYVAFRGQNGRLLLVGELRCNHISADVEMIGAY